MLGRWSVDVSPPLPDGDYTVEAEQGDAAGNVTRRPPRAVTVDTAAPAATPTATATPLPTASAAPVPTPRATPAPAPKLSLSLVVGRKPLATLLKRGIAVRVSCSTRCATTIAVTQGKKVLMRRTLTVSRATTVTLPFPAAAKRALRRLKRVSFSVSATAPGAQPVKLSYSPSR